MTEKPKKITSISQWVITITLPLILAVSGWGFLRLWDDNNRLTVLETWKGQGNRFTNTSAVSLKDNLETAIGYNTTNINILASSIKEDMLEIKTDVKELTVAMNKHLQEK